MQIINKVKFKLVNLLKLYFDKPGGQVDASSSPPPIILTLRHHSVRRGGLAKADVSPIGLFCQCKHVAVSPI